MKPKLKEKKVERSTEYLTLIFKPIPGIQFPDMDVDFLINGQSWKSFMASFDGKEWRAILGSVPKGATVDIQRRSDGAKIKFRRSGNENSKA